MRLFYIKWLRNGPSLDASKCSQPEPQYIFMLYMIACGEERYSGCAVTKKREDVASQHTLQKLTSTLAPPSLLGHAEQRKVQPSVPYCLWDARHNLRSSYQLCPMQYPNTGKVTAWWSITVNWSCSFCLGSTRSHCVAYHQHLPRSSETGCRTSTTGAQLRPKR